MPVAVFVWCIGWSLDWIGSKRKTRTERKSPVQKDLILFVPTPELKNINKVRGINEKRETSRPTKKLRKQ
jgi:hypothetical protein